MLALVAGAGLGAVTSTVFAYFADLHDCRLNFSMIASFWFFAFKRILRFFLLVPSSFNFS